MGPPSKRRGGSGSSSVLTSGREGSGGTSGEAGGGSGGASSSRSSKGKLKEKHGGASSSSSRKNNDGGERSSSSKHDRDAADVRHGGVDRSSTSGRGGSSNAGGSSRNRIHVRASGSGAAKSSSSSVLNENPSVPTGGTTSGSHPPTRRRKALDPTLLARGMSARSIGARVVNHIRAVSPDDVDRDLRHMLAYNAACIAYAQQFFVFKNRALVQAGHYGPVPANAPGMQAGGGDMYAPNGAIMGEGCPQSGGGPYDGMARPGYRGMLPPGSQPLGAPPQPHIAMPVKIDPEEEKRIAMLRKRIAASEAQREVLETEYLSLRAHYVHELHRLRRSRHAVDGQLKILQELVKRRGEVLALRRVRCAVARDVLCCLEQRAKLLGGSGVDLAPQGAKIEEGNEKKTKYDSTEDMEGVEYTDRGNAKRDGKGRIEKKDWDENKTDLMDAWTWIESQLHEAEKACMTLETPKELLFVKPTLAVSGGNSTGPNAANSSQPGRSKSPVRSSSGKVGSEKTENDADGSVNGGPSKKKQRGGGSGPGDSLGSKSGGSGDSSGEKGNKSQGPPSRRGGGSIASDDASSTSATGKNDKEIPPTTLPSNKKNTEGSSVEEPGGGNNQGEDDNVIPWDSNFMPRTPFGVPVFLSYLSIVPDRAVGYGCGDVFGNPPSSLCWFEDNLPETFDDMSKERDELLLLREEAQLLTEELKREREMNKELQREIISGRKRSDEMCAMMAMLRTETEAVLNRHNIILDHPEARSRATALHTKATDYVDDEEEEEDELDHGEMDYDEESTLDDDRGAGEIEDFREERAIKEKAHGGGDETAEDENSHYDEGEVQEDDDVDDGEDHGSLSAEGNDRASGGRGRMKFAADSYSAEGELHDDEDNDGDDENDEEEEGEVFEEEGQPMKEVVVRRISKQDEEDEPSSEKRGGKKLSIKVSLSRTKGGRDEEDEEEDGEIVEDGEEDDEEEEGEIREDDDDYDGNRAMTDRNRAAGVESVMKGTAGGGSSSGHDVGGTRSHSGDKRAFNKRDSEDDGDDASSSSELQPHGSFAAHKRRRRL